MSQFFKTFFSFLCHIYLISLEFDRLVNIDSYKHFYSFKKLTVQGNDQTSEVCGE